MTTRSRDGRGSSRRGTGESAAFIMAVQRMLEAQSDCEAYRREHDAANDNRVEKPEGPTTPSRAA